MILTEKEAWTKWCPIVRTSFYARDPMNHRGAHCIASNCMAWRWQSEGKGYCGAYQMPSNDTISDNSGIFGIPQGLKWNRLNSTMENLTP